MSTASSPRMFAVAAMVIAGAIGLGCDRQATPSTSVQAAPTPNASNASPSNDVAKPARWPFLGDTGTAAASADGASMMRRNYYVVLDGSGSMDETQCSGKESKMVVAQRALGRFIDQLPADVNLGLTVFDNNGIREVVPLRPLDREAAARAIGAVRVGAGTPLAASIRMAYGALTEQGRAQAGYGEFHLVVVTDGEATGENPATVVSKILKESPVVLHTIGFCIGKDHSLNQAGRVIYRAADNPAELAAGLADVLAEAPAFSVQSFK